VVALAGGVVFTLAHRHTSAPTHAAGPTRPTSRHRPQPLTPLRVVATTTPVAGGIAANAPLVVQFSTKLAGNSPTPTVLPAVTGNWTQSADGRRLVFRPVGNYVPLSTVTLRIPDGPAGPRAANGGRLLTTMVVVFRVANGSTLRLDQLLSELGYLPLTFDRLFAATSTADPPSGLFAGIPAVLRRPADGLDAEPTHADAVPVQPLAGTFTWRYAAIAPALAPLWKQGATNTILDGALMAFTADSGAVPTATVSTTTWSALLTAVAARAVDPNPYDFLQVTTRVPETLTVWRDNSAIYRTLANTGITDAPTAAGTYPVYARYESTTMSGFNPDGTHYNDPDVPWVAYFNGGDAVHGFLRGSYGFPQSLGCVELPYSSAEVVFGDDPIGTLVSVN
jgi:hypothetical protein